MHIPRPGYGLHQEGPQVANPWDPVASTGDRTTVTARMKICLPCNVEHECTNNPCQNLRHGCIARDVDEKKTICRGDMGVGSHCWKPTSKYDISISFNLLIPIDTILRSRHLSNNRNVAILSPISDLTRDNDISARDVIGTPLQLFGAVAV